jgi:C4-dicarboxylate-specific signal transduction histidine kinase
MRHNFLDLIHPDDLEATHLAIADLTQQHEVLNFENRFRCKDGSYRWIEWHSRPQGEPIFAAARDTTERKRAEAERQNLMEQLNQAQKIESVGRLAGGVAHDFNNMLGVILGHSELAMAKIGKEHPVYASIGEIRKAADRSAGLTRQLLAFARKQTVSPKVLDLNETVEGMLTMLQRLIGEDIELVWKPGEDLGMVKMDPGKIDQVLANLCVNARDAIGDNR